MGAARGAEAGYVRGSVRRVVLAAGVLSALTASPVAAFDARLGWSPAQSAAGYRVYVRQSGQTYGSGVDVGLIQADASGVVYYVTRGLPNGVVNYFAVTDYDTSGRESVLSNELSLLVTATPTATFTAAVAATPSSTPIGAATASRTATASATRTPTSSTTRTATATATRTPTNSATRAPTGTANPASTATRTAPSTATPTRTVTSTPTPTSSPVGTVAASGPVAAYAFSEGSGTTTADASGNGRTGTLFGSPRWTTGAYGIGLQFSGGTTYDGVSLAPNNGFDGLSQGTLEAWVKFDTGATAGIHDWFDGHDASGCSYPFEFDFNNRSGTVYWEVWAGNTGQCNATFYGQVALANPGNWHHLAYVVGKNGNAWYVDGLLQKPTYVAGSASSTFFFASIAASPNTRYDVGTSETPGETFKGIIDELRIYDQPLTQAQIQADMNAPVTGSGPTATPPRTAIGTAIATAPRTPTASATRTRTASRTPTAAATPTRRHRR